MKTLQSLRVLVFAAAILAAGAIAVWLWGFESPSSGSGHSRINPVEQTTLPAPPTSPVVTKTPPEASVGSVITAKRQSSPAFERLRELMGRDPAAAFAEARKQYTGDRLSRVLEGLAGSLLEKDFTMAPDILPMLQDSMAAQSALFRALPISFRRDRSGTMRIVREGLSGELQGHAFRVMILTQQENGDLLGAIETQVMMPQSSSRMQAITSIAREVAKRDPNAALRWFDRLTDIKERKNLHGWMMDGFSEGKDEGSLISLLELTPAEEQIKPNGNELWNRELLIRRIAWLRQQRGDAEGLEALCEMLPDNEHVIVDAVIIYANESLAPSDRINQLATLDNPQLKNNGISAVVSMEVKKDAAAAAQMVWSLPDTTFPSAMGALVHSWRRADHES